MADEILTPDEPRRSEQSAMAPAARPAGASPFRAYKPSQGTRVRWGTAAGAGVIVVAGAAYVYDWLALPFGGNATLDIVLRTLIPVVLLLAAGYVVFWLVGRNRSTVDFMIATEGEMKKVNWSSRKEVLGATKVVIFTVLALGFLLAVVDLAFMVLFSAIGVLRIPLWQRLFGIATS